VDFLMSDKQRELTEAAAAFAPRELNQDLVKRDDAGEFPREAWRKCAKFGVQGLPVPAELGHVGDPADGDRPDARALSHPGGRGIIGGRPGREARWPICCSGC